MQDHRKLKVWQKAHRLAADVIRAAERRKRGVAGDLRSQMARSAASVSSNIAEGCACEGRRPCQEFCV